MNQTLFVAFLLVLLLIITQETLIFRHWMLFCQKEIGLGQYSACFLL